MIVILPLRESAMALAGPLLASLGLLHTNARGSSEPSEVPAACLRRCGLYHDVELSEALLGEECRSLHMINIF